MKCNAVAGERLFTFTRLPPSQRRRARTTNAIERIRTDRSAGSSGSQGYGI